MARTEAFDAFTDAYEDWFDRHPAFYHLELEAVRRLIPPLGARGMEVGIGSGKFAVPFGVKIGVDPSEKMSEKARVLGLDVCRGVAEALPFRTGVFDFVLMVTTICFVDDILATFREAARVLKREGSIIVGFVDRLSELGRRYAAHKGESRFYREATFFSTDEVMEHLRETDFDPVEIKQTLIPGGLPGTVEDGFGKGAFIAIKAVKRGSRG
ncbi:class I SAM-dependent methyltransferase [Desulfatiglans anilini]|uniref:class I SAM-dependent methyltransferase n=1 Tax=Desulfatiglans anilini TaxID=90728 RepID=UPI0004850D43|nr:class I SAM-dependent methyltransferase [Desulfatiglans anilini]